MAPWRGTALRNAGTITTLTNTGRIGSLARIPSLANFGTIVAVTNKGVIEGSFNQGTITTLTNSGVIKGPSSGTFGFNPGIFNAGTIGALANSGVIQGDKGGPGAEGDAILSTSSIGPIANSGKIIGNVEIDNQASVTIAGGSGKTFGSFTGGAITIGNGDLTFAGGATDLADNISVNGGAGKVTNEGILRLAAPEAITGNFVQTASGTS